MHLYQRVIYTTSFLCFLPSFSYSSARLHSSRIDDLRSVWTLALVVVRTLRPLLTSFLRERVQLLLPERLQVLVAVLNHFQLFLGVRSRMRRMLRTTLVHVEALLLLSLVHAARTSSARPQVHRVQFALVRHITGVRPF